VLVMLVKEFGTEQMELLFAVLAGLDSASATVSPWPRDQWEFSTRPRQLNSPTLI
jgi:hypothetical protein